MKLILTKNTKELVAIQDDAFTLAATDTDVELMSWDEVSPELHTFYDVASNSFKTRWQVMPDDAKLDLIRSKRDAELAKSDYAIIRNSEQIAMGIPTTFTSYQINILHAYRQALRDLTTTCNVNANDLQSIGWPTAPDFI